MTKLRTIALNGVLIGSSLIILVVLFEFVIFRFLFLAADLPYLEENNGGVLRYAPNQSGTYRLHDEISARFRINNKGWNSLHEDYSRDKSQGKKRICIVGDSYVEAFQVRYDSSFSELLEQRLGHIGYEVDVYRFGLSGSPLSHYVYMIENELLTYSPDLIVVNLVHNDFMESIEPAFGTYSDSFSRVGANEAGKRVLTEPNAYVRKPSWWVKNSAIFRYLWVRKQIRPDLLKRNWIRIVEPVKPEGEPIYVANVDIEKTKDERLEGAVQFLFDRLSQIKKQHGVSILLVIDGNRSSIRMAIEKGSNMISAVGHLNELTRKAAEKYGLEFLDLTTSFTADYKKNRKSFRFNRDGHWNNHAHSVVADTIFQKVVESGIL